MLPGSPHSEGKSSLSVGKCELRPGLLMRSRSVRRIRIAWGVVSDLWSTATTHCLLKEQLRQRESGVGPALTHWEASPPHFLLHTASPQQAVSSDTFFSIVLIFPTPHLGDGTPYHPHGVCLVLWGPFLSSSRIGGGAQFAHVTCGSHCCNLTPSRMPLQMFG